MLPYRSGLAALFLLSLACSHDKKNDRAPDTFVDSTGQGSQDSTVSFSIESASSIKYAYGDYFSGYKAYQYDVTTGVLNGRWDRLSTTMDPETGIRMLQATASVELKDSDRQPLAALVANLQSSIVSTDQSGCGILQDGPVNSVVVTEKVTAKDVRITDEDNKDSICADAYVAKNSMKTVFEFFHKLLPQPEDPAAYKPKAQ